MTGKTSKGVAVNVCQHYFVSPGILPLSSLFTVGRSQRFCQLSETTYTAQMPGSNGLVTFTFKQTWRHCTRNATKPPSAMRELRPCTNTCVVPMRGLVRTFLIVLIYNAIKIPFSGSQLGLDGHRSAEIQEPFGPKEDFFHQIQRELPS